MPTKNDRDSVVDWISAGKGSTLRIALTGLSGAGKSTGASFVEEACTRNSLSAVRLKLAAPLYELQSIVYATAGCHLPDHVQDQELMSIMATQLRRINSRALVDRFARAIESANADVIINDDVRDSAIDLPYLRSVGFRVWRVVCDDTVRRARLDARGDRSVVDEFEFGLVDDFEVDEEIVNSGSLQGYCATMERLVQTALGDVIDARADGRRGDR